MRAVLELDDPSATVKALLDGGANPCLRGRDGKLPSFIPDPESETWRLLVNAGGFLDLNTGVCMHDAWKADEKEKALGLSRDARRGIQSCLKTQGFDPGPADGLFGPRTRAAIRSWQEAQGQDGSEAAGHISSQDQLDELLAGCRVALKPLCTGETGTPCWQEVANQPGCHLWNSNPQPEETVTWSGDCDAQGRANGKGKSIWRFREDGTWRTSVGEGELRGGKQFIGVGFFVTPMALWVEGPYVEGKRHGHWIWRLRDGTVWEGPYVDGEFHGLWVAQRSKERNCWQKGEDRHEAACGLRAVNRAMQAAEQAVRRRGPGRDYSQAHGKLEAGAKVTVTHEAGDWLRVEDARGNTGFVLASVLEEVKEVETVAEEPQAVSSEPKVAAVVTEPKCAYGTDEKGDSSLTMNEVSKLDDWLGSQDYRAKWLDGYAAFHKALMSYGIVYEKCWLPVKNIPGCYVFVGTRFSQRGWGMYVKPWHVPRPTVEWTGICKDDVVNGNGVIKFKTATSYASSYVDGLNFEQEAHFVNGKQNGRVTQEDSYGEWEGEFVNGLLQGKSIFRSKLDEVTYTSNYEDGLFHGENVRVEENAGIQGCTLIETERYSHGQKIEEATEHRFSGC